MKYFFALFLTIGVVTSAPTAQNCLSSCGDNISVDYIVNFIKANTNKIDVSDLLGKLQTAGLNTAGGTGGSISGFSGNRGVTSQIGDRFGNLPGNNIRGFGQFPGRINRNFGHRDGSLANGLESQGGQLGNGINGQAGSLANGLESQGGQLGNGFSGQAGSLANGLSSSAGSLTGNVGNQIRSTAGSIAGGASQIGGQAGQLESTIGSGQGGSTIGNIRGEGSSSTAGSYSGSSLSNLKVDVSKLTSKLLGLQKISVNQFFSIISEITRQTVSCSCNKGDQQLDVKIILKILESLRGSVDISSIYSIVDQALVLSTAIGSQTAGGATSQAGQIIKNGGKTIVSTIPTNVNANAQARAGVSAGSSSGGSSFSFGTSKTFRA